MTIRQRYVLWAVIIDYIGIIVLSGALLGLTIWRGWLSQPVTSLPPLFWLFYAVASVFLIALPLLFMLLHSSEDDLMSYSGNTALLRWALVIPPTVIPVSFLVFGSKWTAGQLLLMSVGLLVVVQLSIYFGLLYLAKLGSSKI